MESPCIVCGAPVAPRLTGLFDTRFGIPDECAIVACQGCGLEQTRPLPTQQRLKELYERYYNFGGETGTKYARVRSWFFAGALYRFWLWVDGDISFHAMTGNGRLLDVGCNEGRGLGFYRANGFEAEGLELNETAAAAARAQGFTVHSELIERFEPRAAYDVVILSNVLEHSLDPKTMLMHVRRILNRGGRVGISCPNSASAQRDWFGRGWINWHVPFHIAHFSDATLRQLLSRAGFEVVETRQESPAMWAAGSVIASLVAKRGVPNRRLRSVPAVVALLAAIRGLCFPALWWANRRGRGDGLVVVARKV